ncbi:hypothetical protein F4Y93_09010 [Candidatus Poribacteria bacterium]|nr:hypothetical protein [Candidatus Poribacteria bacterium]
MKAKDRRREYEANCGRKQVFRTLEAAEAEAARRDEDLHAYACPIARHYHVGHEHRGHDSSACHLCARYGEPL